MFVLPFAIKERDSWEVSRGNYMHLTIIYCYSTQHMNNHIPKINRLYIIFKKKLHSTFTKSVNKCATEVINLCS